MIKSKLRPRNSYSLQVILYTYTNDPCFQLTTTCRPVPHDTIAPSVQLRSGLQSTIGHKPIRIPSSNLHRPAAVRLCTMFSQGRLRQPASVALICCASRKKKLCLDPTSDLCFVARFSSTVSNIKLISTGTRPYRQRRQTDHPSLEPTIPTGQEILEQLNQLAVAGQYALIGNNNSPIGGGREGPTSLRKIRRE